MFKKFLRDTTGNYAITAAIALIPIMSAVGLGVDYTQLTNHKSNATNALEAAGIAVGRRVTEGADDAALLAYGKAFFEANLGPVDPANTVFKMYMPDTPEGNGNIKLVAEMTYKPLFMGMAATLVDQSITKVEMDTVVKVKLKNTSEIALVLDNSGSMDNTGTGSSKKRITLLKEASKYLVQALADEAKLIKQIDKPVQFSVVPFSASVNVGADNASASWMDTDGLSPVHHENFDWTTLSTLTGTHANKGATNVAGIWYKSGTGWGPEEGQKLTRFTLFNDIKKQTGTQTHTSTQTVYVPGREEWQWVCTRYRNNGNCRVWGWREVEVPGYYENQTVTTETPILGPLTSWKGCVEARPYPYNNNDAAAATNNPATLFVPMFAPDEPDTWSGYYNRWWTDTYTGSPGSYNSVARSKNMAKYYANYAPLNTSEPGLGSKMHEHCTTTPITPLKDVTKAAGLTAINEAIDAMSPTGMTNVPEGIAWGWRAVSHGAPFTEGRPDSDNGNDKVLIVLTDGANTYSDINNDSSYAGLQSEYGAYGYTGRGYNGTSTTRMFMGTSNDIGQYDYSSSNYSEALNEQMADVCTKAKAEGLTIFTVALDLAYNEEDDSGNDRNAARGLKACASESRFRKDGNGNYQKLFYNSKGGDLLDVFKAIGEELSNLRVVG